MHKQLRTQLAHLNRTRAGKVACSCPPTVNRLEERIQSLLHVRGLFEIFRGQVGAQHEPSNLAIEEQSRHVK